MDNSKEEPVTRYYNCRFCKHNNNKDPKKCSECWQWDDGDDDYILMNFEDKE